jgi:hypothetical protein
MSEGELDGICSALKALKIGNKKEIPQDIPINTRFDTLILRQHLNACIDKLRVVIYQFYQDHRSSVDGFIRTNNFWYFRYHNMSVKITAHKVMEYNESEEMLDYNVDTTTHITMDASYNIKDLYGNSPLDTAVLDEILEFYSDIKEGFADYE